MNMNPRIKLILVALAFLAFALLACDDTGWQSSTPSAPTPSAETMEKAQSLFNDAFGSEGAYPTPEFNRVAPIKNPQPVRSQIIK